MGEEKAGNNKQDETAGQDSADVFVLPANLDISSATEFLGDVQQALSSNNGPLSLDAGGVEKITTPAVQILLSVSSSLQQRGDFLAVTSSSQPFEEAFEDLGLITQFRAWKEKNV